MSRVGVFRSSMADVGRSYTGVVRRAFILERLYGGKYTPHVGSHSSPFVYLKTLVRVASRDLPAGLCTTTGHWSSKPSGSVPGSRVLLPSQSNYLLGLLDALVPQYSMEEAEVFRGLQHFCASHASPTTSSSLSHVSCSAAPPSSSNQGRDAASSSSSDVAALLQLYRQALHGEPRSDEGDEDGDYLTEKNTESSLSSSSMVHQELAAASQQGDAVGEGGQQHVGESDESVDDPNELESLESLAASLFHGVSARVLILDAILTCMAAKASLLRLTKVTRDDAGRAEPRTEPNSSDGLAEWFSATQRQSVNELARRVAVSSAVLLRLELLVEQESQQRWLKRRLLLLTTSQPTTSPRFLRPSRQFCSVSQSSASMSVRVGEDTRWVLNRMRPEEEVEDFLLRCQPKRRELLQLLHRVRRRSSSANKESVVDG